MHHRKSSLDGKRHPSTPFHQNIDVNVENKGLRVSGLTYFLISSSSQNLSFGKITTCNVFYSSRKTFREEFT